MLTIKNTLDKQLYLQMILRTIERMTDHCVRFKKWSLWLFAIMQFMFAIEMKVVIGVLFILIIICFCILDGFYLAQERTYRKLFIINQPVENNITFSLNTKHYFNLKLWLSSIFSKSVLWFYTPLLACLLIETFFIF